MRYEPKMKTSNHKVTSLGCRWVILVLQAWENTRVVVAWVQHKEQIAAAGLQTPIAADQQRLADVVPEAADSCSWIWKAGCSTPVLPEPILEVISDLCHCSSVDLGEGENVSFNVLSWRRRRPMAPTGICRSRRRSRLSNAEVGTGRWREKIASPAGNTPSSRSVHRSFGGGR
ncbi:hypothetical protein GW17_00028298 [Ensete ventricosum]|nr:hypothetical protein GW17_00028298 [Ensete ventricosum]RZR97321.1 hypothetical protein BHM03_00026475 [Ensete ventricosum]